MTTTGNFSNREIPSTGQSRLADILTKMAQETDNQPFTTIEPTIQQPTLSLKAAL